MRLGIMQPYFFPYLGHFALIANVDEWIVFDVTQYTPKTWINRNRVLHPTSGANWVSVPLKNSSISIRICEARGPRSRRRRQVNSRQAQSLSAQGPFCETCGGDRRSRPSPRRESAIRWSASTSQGLDAVCAYLGVPFQPADLLGDEAASAGTSGAWRMGAGDCEPCRRRTYVNPIGGRALFKTEDFENRGVRLEFLETEDFVYETGSFTFIPNLSILDVLMWNSPEVVRKALKAVTTVVEAGSQ